MATIATRRRNGITKPRPIWPGYEPKTISNFTNLQDAGNCFRRDAQFEWLKDEIAAERRAQAIQLLQFDFSGWKLHQAFGRRFKSDTTPQNIVNRQTIGR